MARLVRYEKEEHHSSNPIRLRKPELAEKIKEILEKELEVELGKEKVEKLKDFIKEIEKSQILGEAPKYWKLDRVTGKYICQKCGKMIVCMSGLCMCDCATVIEEKVVQPTSAGETDLWLSKKQAVEEMKERGTPIMLIPATYNPDRRARALQGDFYISGYSWIGYGTIDEALDFLPEGLNINIQLRNGEIIRVR